MTATNVEEPKGLRIMAVLDSLQPPVSVALTLRTLTPLYTGGVGQHGDQIHPSGLLGGLRKFSCLLAAAVGEGGFETRVWGSTAEDRHAKRIALRWDLSGLQSPPLTLPTCIKLEHPGNHKGWYYNVAHFGKLGLTLTRRGIENDDWLIVLLALRIQINWATFGSRDQWGLGVLNATGDLPRVDPLSNQPVTSLDQPGLHRAFFARLEFDRPVPDQWRDRLEQGLRWRAHLRNSFRQAGESNLRHYLFGHLAQGKNDQSQGGAINVSAIYPLDNERSALRIWGIIPHTTPPTEPSRQAPHKEQEEYEYRRKVLLEATNNRHNIIQRIRSALQQDVAGATPARASRLIWEDGGAQTDLPNWLNCMAGV